jgi:hypothetical protein
MKPPNVIAIKLYEMGAIKALSVNQKYVSEDQAETYVVLRTQDKTMTLSQASFNKYLKLELDWCSIAQLNDTYATEVKKWKEFEKQNEKDLKEFERLKKKLFDPTPVEKEPETPELPGIIYFPLNNI